jgi:uncharacterized protein (TIGR03435 family)
MRLSLAALVVLSCSQVAPSQNVAASARPQFEVAAIKLDTSGSKGGNIGVAPGGRFRVDNVPVRFMIRFAYGVQDFQVSGGPSWMNTDNYDVDAKDPDDVPFQQVRPLLQTMLEDRFKLVIHHETKDVPIFELVPAKGGVKIAASTNGRCVIPDPKNLPKPGEPLPHFCGNIGMRPNLIEAWDVPMERFVATLSNVLGRTVVDKTGVTGKIDVHLEFTPDEISAGQQAEAAAAADLSKPSIFLALQEQLGLKVQGTKAPGDLLVIDHLERPSEN